MFKLELQNRFYVGFKGIKLFALILIVKNEAFT